MRDFSNDCGSINFTPPAGTGIYIPFPNVFYTGRDFLLFDIVISADVDFVLSAM